MDAGWHVGADVEGGVEFLIGMRWSALWRLPTRPWVARSFLAMCGTDPSSGLERSRLGLRAGGPVVVQRWRSRLDLDWWASTRTMSTPPRGLAPGALRPAPRHGAFGTS